GFECAAYVDHRVEDVVLDVDQLQGVPGGVPVVGHDEGDLLALEPHLVGGQHRLDVTGQCRHPGQPALLEHRARDDRPDLRVRRGGGGGDADDARVRERRPEHGEVEHAGQLDVVAEVSLAPDEAAILLAEHPAVPTHLGAHGEPSWCSAAHCTERTMVAYPV